MSTDQQPAASRIVHVSHVVGDDQLGDGSLECPYATHGHARRIAGPGDVFCIDGFIQARDDLPHRKAGMIALLAAGAWLAVLLLVVLAVHNPSLAFLVGMTGVIGVVAFAGEKDLRRRTGGQR